MIRKPTHRDRKIRRKGRGSSERQSRSYQAVLADMARFLALR